MEDEEERKKKVERGMLVKELMKQTKICESFLDFKQEGDFLLRRCNNNKNQVEKRPKNDANEDSVDAKTRFSHFNDASSPLSRQQKVRTPVTVEHDTQTGEEILLLEPKIEIIEEDTEIDVFGVISKRVEKGSEQVSSNELEDFEAGEDFDEPAVCLWFSEGNSERCGREFVNVRTMTDHIKKDHMPGPDSSNPACAWQGCKRKGLPFDTIYPLLRHLLMHTGEKPYRCSVEGCGKRFTCGQNLQMHRNAHTKQKFPCKFPGCPKEFNFKQTAEEHYRVTHLGDDRNKCEFDGCGRTFAKLNDLRRHAVTHTGEKAYACTVDGCGKSYAGRAALGKHVRRKHQRQEDVTSPDQPQPTSSGPQVVTNSANGLQYPGELFGPSMAQVSPTSPSNQRRSFTIPFKLAVVDWAKSHSGEAAARHFNVDPKRVRMWKRQEAALRLQKEQEDGKAAKGSNPSRRLKGAGRKRLKKELDPTVFEWIVEQRRNNIRVSRSAIRNYARNIYPTLLGAHRDFNASHGWLHRFLNRHRLSLRKTAAVQKDPAELNERVVSFINYVSQRRRLEKVPPGFIVAADETSVRFDAISATPGHEKGHFTVMLAAKADGTKLKPYVIFKNGMTEVRKLQPLFGNLFIRSSENGWMNDELVADWLKETFLPFQNTRTLLVWDAYKCHISESTKTTLEKYNATAAVLPWGTAKYAQPADVSWNKPFKARMTVYYDRRMAEEKGGNPKAPSKKLVLRWVEDAWNSIDDKIIASSFKACGITNSAEGGEDDLIQCMMQGGPCEEARKRLTEARMSRELEELRMETDEEEDERNEVLIDSDGEGPRRDGAVQSDYESPTDTDIEEK